VRAFRSEAFVPCMRQGGHIYKQVAKHAGKQGHPQCLELCDAVGSNEWLVR